MQNKNATSRNNRRMGRKSRLRTKVQNATRSTVSRSRRGDYSGRIK